MMWYSGDQRTDETISTDASGTGYGIFCQGLYSHGRFPPHILDTFGHNIAILELIALVVGVKLHACRLKGRAVLMMCDNKAVVDVVNSGAATNEHLQDWLRELCYVTAMNECRVVTRHLSSSDNRLADYLSRWHQSTVYQTKISARGNTRIGIRLMLI